MRAPSFRITRIVVCAALLVASAVMGLMCWLAYNDHVAEMSRIGRVAEVAAAVEADGYAEADDAEETRSSVAYEGRHVASLQTRAPGFGTVDKGKAKVTLEGYGLDGLWSEMCDATSWELASMHVVASGEMDAVWIGTDDRDGVVAYAIARWSSEKGKFSNPRVIAVKLVSENTEAQDLSSSAAAPAEDGEDAEGSGTAQPAEAQPPAAGGDAGSVSEAQSPDAAGKAGDGEQGDAE